MLAQLTRMPRPRAARRLLAPFVLSSALLASVGAHAAGPIETQLADISEEGRHVPLKALERLRRLEPQLARAPLAERADYLFVASQLERSSGKYSAAMDTAEELVKLGKYEHDNAALAKGLLAKAYAAFAMDDLKRSHQLAWEAERIANTTNDRALCVRAAIGAGQSFAEEGNFPPALAKLQNAVGLARQLDDPILLIAALQALAVQYSMIREFDKGFDTLDEAMALAVKHQSPGRIASLKEVEYGLAVETGQHERGLKALQHTLEYERKIGAESMIATTLVNLADSYLRRHDYPRTLAYGKEALESARRFGQKSTEATAELNIGQAYLGMGRVAEGKQHFEAGLAWYEKTGDKPELREVLAEYGAALERAGDMAGAIRAYHRERALADELFEDRRQKATLELRERYEAEGRQRQILLLQRENDVKSAEIYSRKLEQRVWWLLALVFALASSIVGVLYRKVRTANAQLKVKNLELKRQSSRDPLTGLYNRRHFQEFMRNHTGERERQQRATDRIDAGAPGALFLLDVDHFKHVNDTHGHAAGDAVLIVIADSLRDILRGTDMIVRWGGEEFLAYLPTIPRGGLDEVASRLLAGISANVVPYQGSMIAVHASIGYAPFPLIPGAPPLSWERAVNLVDMALYMAKAHGRNRAYGVGAFSRLEQTTLEEIEQDLEMAWRDGFVDLSVVLGEQRAVKSAALSVA